MRRLISTLDLPKEEWLRYRKKGITGTDAGAICGLNPYASAFQIYQNKISEDIEQRDNESMRQGRDLEEYVAQRFTEETGLKIRKANAIYQNIAFIERYDPQYVIILSGDQICKQDYSDFLEFHKKKGAEFSVAVMEVPWEDASRFGLMVADEDDKITEFQEKPKEPKSNLASMGIYIFNWDILKKYLIEDEADPNSENDFGNNIIPNLLRDGRKMYAYHFNGYWKDVGTIPSLWEANMEVLDPEHSGINLFDENWKIYSRNSGMTGHRIGENAVLDNCLITDGCNIKGTVRHSILFSGVTVEEGAIVEDAVVMGHSTIKAGAVVRHCIIAENATVEEDAVVGAKPEGEGVGEVATIAADVTIGKGAKIGPSAMIYEDVKEGEEQC